MSSVAKSPWNPDRLDVRAFAQAAATLSADEPLSRFERLMAERAPGADGAGVLVHWQAQGALRPGLRGASPAVWLQVQARVTLPLACQRCLAPVDSPLVVDRWYRFVADEDTAAKEDEDCEEDVLALEPRPSLRQLVEDELLMDLPLVPMHGRCPEPPTMVAGDADAPPADGAGRPHPFAQLARLKK
jgi:uncharacterized protein